MTTLADLALRIEPISEGVTGGAVYEAFQADPDLLVLAVVDSEGAPVGLVDRNSFALKMGSTYGRALYAGRPISTVMEREPLIAPRHRQVSDFAEEALAGRPSSLVKGIIVTSEGKYFGVTTITSILKDVTDQARAQSEQLQTLASSLSSAKSEVQTANDRLKEALDAMSEGVALFDADDACVLWNSKYAGYHQQTADILTPGISFAEILRHGAANGQYDEAIGREQAWVAERLERRAAVIERTSEEQSLVDGRFVRIEDTRLPSGGVISVAVDITEVHRREASFRLLFDNNPVPLGVFERESLKVVAANAAAATQFGYAVEDFLKLSVLDLLAPHERDRAVERFAQPRLEGFAGEWRHQKPNGERLIIKPIMRPLTYNGRSAMLVAAVDVTAQREAEQALKAAVQSAEAANAAKSEFLANMSHEIRTPLNGVLGVASVLGRTALTASQTEMVDIIETSAKTLQILLNDLLDVAKIESGHLELQPEPVVLAKLIRQTAALFATTATERGLGFDIAMDDAAESPVLVDGVRWSQIVTNLCSNAIKFTEAGRVSLRLSASLEGDRLRTRISVSDTGIGISNEARERLFERFSQADGSITRRFGGTGLGLAISQHLASLMGGVIEVDSEEGGGSTFALELTFPRAERQTEHEVSVLDAEAIGPVGRERRMRVLLVEDHPVNRQVIQLILGELVDLTMAENGAEGVAAEALEPFDVILMDMQMPVLDGVSATRAIRAREQRDGACRTPIVMLTANVLAEHVDLAREAGADLHLAKPITAPALMQAIEQALADPLQDENTGTEMSRRSA